MKTKAEEVAKALGTLKSKVGEAREKGGKDLRLLRKKLKRAQRKIARLKKAEALVVERSRKKGAEKKAGAEGGESTA